jgi:predicted extracellular nuclease
MQRFARSLFCLLVITLLITGCGLFPKAGQPTITPTAAAVPTLDGRLRINQIQGAQHRSPYDGKRVSGVEGIVTAITGSGFYLQDSLPDTDERTSEALFVSASAFGNISVGDFIRIETAKVREYNPAGLGENSLTRTELFQVS